MPQKYPERLFVNHKHCFFLGISALTLIGAPCQPSERQLKTSQVGNWVSAKMDTVVLFTGYPGCSTVCPRALPAMAAAIKSFPNRTSTAYLFVNIIPGYDPDMLRTYTSAYHAAIIAVQPSAEELTRLTAELNLSHGASPVFRNEYDHSGWVFILVRSGSQFKVQHRIFVSSKIQDRLMLALSKSSNESVESI
jgi:cytochrome oxidase Cu insertion factor (SCO1/SenC/PrrC family)